MTDVSNLDDLANKIANSSPNIKKYAQAQAAATQSQEAEIRKLREDVEVLKRSVSPPPDGGVGGTPPPPPPTGELASPLGFFSNRAPGYWPPTHIADYGIISSEGPPTAGFVGLNIFYRTGITCQSGYTNIDANTALANGWVMTDASGPLTSAAYGGYLADPGLPAYQQAWCNASYTRAQQLQGQGFWVDDMTPRLDAISGGRWPTKYPNVAAYKVALLSFFQYVKNYMDAHGGMKFVPNTALPEDNTAALTTAWWQQAAPYCHYLSIEFWMNPGGYIRRVGPEWWNNWDNFRNLHSVCQAGGAGFFPLSEGGGTQVMQYSLGTYMLDWTGALADGTNVYIDSATQTTDPWTTFYAQARALGAPSAAATKVGTVWTRSFANGTLTVDPVNATATITGV